MPSGTVGLYVARGRDPLGERAIRAAMEEWLRGAGIDYELAAGAASAERHRSLLICGSSPISEADLAPGAQHALSAAALPDSGRLAPLADYAYVSVRSKADLGRARSWREDAAVVPCVTNRRAAPPPPARKQAKVGVHLDLEALSSGAAWHEALRRLRGLDQTYLPLAPEERGVLSRLMHAAGDGRAAGATSVEEIVEAIGTLRLLVCSSLQAAIFACMQNVPFLVRSYSPEVAEYLADRGLEPWTFRTPEELLERALRLLDAAPDYREIVDRDGASLAAHFEILEQAVKRGGRVGVPETLRSSAPRIPRYAFTGRAGVEAAPPAPPLSGTKIQALVGKLDVTISRLHREVESQKERIGELAAEVDRLQGEIDRRGADIDRRGAEIDRLALEADRLNREVRSRDEELARIRSSLPWRVLHALRAIVAKLRGSTETKP